MVRKVIATLVCALALTSAVCGSAQAALNDVYYNGGISSTYLEYFKGIVSGLKFNDEYVLYRNSQYSYVMVVGDLSLTDEGKIISSGDYRVYQYTTDNGQHYYYVEDMYAEEGVFVLDYSNYIIYSNVTSDYMSFPHLEERGAKYEILTTILLCIALLCVVIHRIFSHR